MFALASRSFVAATLFVVGLTMINPNNANAADRFGVVSIANETQATMTIMYKWGTESWRKVVLKPGQQQWFSWKYAKVNDRHSPNFTVKFDADSGTGKYSEEYLLKRKAAPEQSFNLGHKYVFRYDGPSKRYIELFNIDK